MKKLVHYLDETARWALLLGGMGAVTVAVFSQRIC